jgi:uncharacterized protein
VIAVFRTILKWVLRLVLLFAVILAILIAWNFDTIQRHFLGGVKVYETKPPAMPSAIKRPAILVFSKTNGYRHEDSIKAAGGLLSAQAKAAGWGYFQTENGAAFNPDILSRFDAVVFNNVSGDPFTADQRAAFKAYVENGGGFVAIHASGGDFSYAWDWYVNELIGTQFIGHPMNPQFQKARVNVVDKSHPATASLPDTLERTDEWYSFAKPPRRPDYHVLMTLDESTYRTVFEPSIVYSKNIAMGKDHPITWWHCQGKGRAFYTAMGHTKESYAEPAYQSVLAGAVRWALRLEGQGCATPSALVKNGKQ